MRSIILNGMRADVMDLSIGRPVIEYWSADTDFPMLTPSHSRATLSMRVYDEYGEQNYRNQLLWDDLSRCNANLVGLGDGWLCQGCGQYHTAGMARCPNCGAIVERVPFIRPARFPFMLASINQQVFYRDEPSYIEMELVSNGALTDDTMSMFFGASMRLVGLPHHYSLTGHYLCRWCGGVVPEGESCPGCGGRRVPLQEVVQLERTCLYCGKTVTGGIVCPGCNVRIRGVTFKEAMVV